VDAEDTALLDLASCKSTKSKRFKECLSKVLRRALKKRFPADYLKKYTGKRMALLLNEFKKQQQQQLLSVQKKAVKIRQENIEDEVREEAYLANNEHKQVAAQQDEDLNMDELMKELPKVEEDIVLS
jgi:hypothetical protein